ncbi:DUF192 domain-containing protein [Candidatus Saccharibacteria bacterium]|nr:MAG: DUF192 domain-containing protein [Candidatus Saccharibacteria bacterium]
MQNHSSVTLNHGNYSYNLEKAVSPALREKGLGDRKNLAKGKGMLFVFETPEKVCFWMKDMKFSIDIIWLDAQKRVTHIEQAVSPSTYPQSYCPDQPAKYVIELNTGEAARSGIHTGQTLSF